MDQFIEELVVVLVMSAWFGVLIGNGLFSPDTWHSAYKDIYGAAIDLKNLSAGRFFYFLDELFAVFFLIGFALAPMLVTYWIVERWLL